MEEKQIGKIIHYFEKIGVAVVAVGGIMKSGDRIHIKGTHTDFTQSIGSMQIEHKAIREAKAGQEIGFKVDQPVKEHDIVYSI
ncbi:MAG: translation elongation factor-like protein [Candidatus Woesearchaeota archaeon]|nr:translation elongation factor-like protein [Candidatus Woesearchaeota archaeon]